jgi:hypothetical protein
MTVDDALKVADLTARVLQSLIAAIAGAKEGQVDVSKLDIPKSYYDLLRESGATDEEIAALKV